MGFSYTNVTLSGPSQAEIIEFITETGRRAYVSPTFKGLTVVYDEESESQDTEILSLLAEAMSARFRCPALAVLDHEDAVLFYQLFIGGILKDEYVSAPDAFDMDEEDAAEVAGDAAFLCTVFGALGKEEKVREVLAIKGKYRSEYERHGELLNALDLPRIAVGLGYDAIASTKQAERIASSGLIHITPVS